MAFRSYGIVNTYNVICSVEESFQKYSWVGEMVTTPNTKFRLEMCSINEIWILSSCIRILWRISYYPLSSEKQKAAWISFPQFEFYVWSSSYWLYSYLNCIELKTRFSVTSQASLPMYAGGLSRAESYYLLFRKILLKVLGR